MRWLAVLIITAAMVLPGMSGEPQEQPTASWSPYVDTKGNLSLPRDVRKDWVHLGSYVVPKEKPKGQGFHDVYANRATVEAYRKTGKFPDGATLVKEVRALETARMTTGEAHSAGKTSLWFVMVKDAKGRFPDNPIWGNGWGWGLFHAKDPTRNVATSWRTDCLGCHIPAQQSDWVFVEGYPTLRK